MKLSTTPDIVTSITACGFLAMHTGASYFLSGFFQNYIRVSGRTFRRRYTFADQNDSQKNDYTG